MTIPVYLLYYVLGGSVAVIAAILIGLNLALKRANWLHYERTKVVRNTALVLIGWFAVATVLASLGLYQGASGRVPTIQYAIVLPILVGALFIARSTTVSSLINAVPQEWMVGVQLYRALGVIFLVLYVSGTYPVCLHGPPVWATSVLGCLLRLSRGPLPAIRALTPAQCRCGTRLVSPTSSLPWALGS